jgi:membrane-associated phospholipid phosphatase
MVNFWNQPSARLCFAVQFIMIAAVLIGAALVPFSIDTSKFKDVFICFAGGLFLVALSAFPVIRFKNDSSHAAVLLRGVFGRAIDASAILVFSVLYIATGGPLSYIVMSAGMPMQDALYASIDQSLGLDWQAFVGFVNARPWLCDVLVWSYDHWIYQIMAVIGLFMLQTRQRELWDLAALLALGLLFTIIFCGLMPAVAAYTYYAPDARYFDVLAQKTPAVGTGFVTDLLAVHSGTFKIFDWPKMKGIVTFPSFHAIVAMTAVYAVRNDRLLFWPAVLFNALVVVSVVPVGGHYFVDIIGSALAVTASMALIDWVNCRPSMAAWLKRVVVNHIGRPSAPSLTA